MDELYTRTDRTVRYSILVTLYGVKLCEVYVPGRHVNVLLIKCYAYRVCNVTLNAAQEEILISISILILK